MSVRSALLRFDAPLISFGAPAIDHHRVVQPMPALSMLSGLLANALGYHHGEHDRLQRLQDRLRFAARTDRAGQPLEDYQIVDLGQPWMDCKRNGWTTRGRPMERSGASGEALHIRDRHFRADSVHTVAVRLHDPNEPPTIEDLAAALEQPARPLFLGRKTCLPSCPILLRLVEAPSLVDALAREPRLRTRGDEGPLVAWWDEGEDESAASGAARLVAVTDERDWKNQIHTGRRLVRQGRLDPPMGDIHG